MEKPRTLLKTVPATELRLPISSIPENGMIPYFQIRPNTHISKQIHTEASKEGLESKKIPNYTK